MTATTPALDREAVLSIGEKAPVVSVVGDLLLDAWWTGSTDRVTREAPAPVVELAERVNAPGGAANTAVNLAALGARVRLSGWVGDDQAGRTLIALLTAAGIDVDRVAVVAGRTTTSKTRVVVAEQVLVRLDDLGAVDQDQGPDKRRDGKRHDRSDDDEIVAHLAAAVRDARIGADAEIFCDYGGRLIPSLATDLAEAPNRPDLVVVDAHDLRPWAVLAPDVVTPNASEAALLAAADLPSSRADDERRLQWAHDLGPRLLDAARASSVVVTLDHTGSVLLGRRGDDVEIVHRTWARPGREANASGAGDSFVAGLTASLAAGLPLTVGLSVAQAAADVVVNRFGTSVCSAADLLATLPARPEVIWDPDALEAALRRERALGRRIVLTNGCFDVLHRGHTTSLAEAAGLGDVLVVAINDDASTRRQKGPTRPINPLTDRAGVVDALSCVDYVTSFASDTAVDLIRRIRPDVYAKGGDYLPEMMAETQAVAEVGGDVRILGYVTDHSTTRIVDRIRRVAHSDHDGTDPSNSADRTAS